MASPFKNLKLHGVAFGGVLVKTAAKTAIGAGTSYGLARYYHGKKDATATRVYLGAAIAKVIPALAALFGGDIEHMGARAALGALDAGGQGAVDFLAVVHGLRHAREAKGVKAVLMPARAEMKVLPEGNFADAELVGALGLAQPGVSMDLNKLRDIQSYR